MTSFAPRRVFRFFSLGGLALAALAACSDGYTSADATNVKAVSAGKELYAANCASCHGATLEGQPNWKETLADGTLPAPPHNDDGHTWHHPDSLLFKYTKKGGAAIAPPGFKSAMPGFTAILSDSEIWSVLSFIKSRWSPRTQVRQARMNRKP